MTFRRDPQYAGGLINRALRLVQLSGTMPVGGRTHNFSATDLAWEDTDCANCGRAFQAGEELMLVVTRVEAGQMFTLPAHRSCPR